MDVTKYIDDVEKYVKKADKKAVEMLYRRLAGVLGRRDASTVAASDKKELARIKYNFIAKRLEVKGEKADAALAAVCKTMKKTRQKNRLTFYYLLAVELKKIARLKK